MSTRTALHRVERKFASLSIDHVEHDGRFCGYASLFGEVDLGKDAILPGAFLKSVRERGPSGIRMLWQHDPNEPIGVWTHISEDHRGLYVEGKLTAGVTRAREVLELMRAGAVDGLSIGFRTVRAKADGKGVRHIHEADLWEISVVTFPMLPSARVGQVKATPGKPAHGNAIADDATSSQRRLLWNFKANEVLIETLKLASPSESNRRWRMSLEAENEVLKSRSTLYAPFQLWRKYSPDQPRVSAGNPDGGQWTDGDGGGGSGTRIVSGRGRFGGAVALAGGPKPGSKSPDGTAVELAQARGGGGRRGSSSGRMIGGRRVPVTPQEELEIQLSASRADAAVRRVQQRDPNWKPQPGMYDSARGEILNNRRIEREAQNSERELDSEAFGHNGGRVLHSEAS